MQVREIMKFLDEKAPAESAEDWDNVGLLVGDPSIETRSVVVSVDLSRECLEAAVKSGARLIINHHPCIFPGTHGLTRLQPGREDALSTLMFECIKRGIAIFATHTNFDQCALEVPQMIAAGLGVDIDGRLISRARGADDSTFLKLVTFIPRTHFDAVREAVFGAGAGGVGHYDRCGFSCEGEGSFRGKEGTQPFLGKPGKFEQTTELRFEVILPRGLKARVLKALLKAHPYEEVAYDFYPIIQQAPSMRSGGFGLGYGFYGKFKEPISFQELTARVKRTFKIDGYLSTKPLPPHFKRVAFAAGKGAGFLPAARAAGCDLFITGEAGYHVALDGLRSGVTVVELGHRESEYYFAEVVGEWLRSMSLEPILLQETHQSIVTS